MVGPNLIFYEEGFIDDEQKNFVLVMNEYYHATRISQKLA